MPQRQPRQPLPVPLFLRNLPLPLRNLPLPLRNLSLQTQAHRQLVPLRQLPVPDGAQQHAAEALQQVLGAAVVQQQLEPQQHHL